jgi:uncharacterized membrane protein
MDPGATTGNDGQRPDSDSARKVELVISALLRAGVVTSLMIVLAGTALTFVHHPEYAGSRRELARLTGPGAEFPHSIPAVIRGIEHRQGRALVTAGLLLLIATPVLRVAVSTIAFAYQRDRTFVVITSIVLTLLMASFILGKAGG